MPAITIVGLGPGHTEFWTQAATNQLQQAADLYLRTPHHPSVPHLSGTIHILDEAGLNSDAFEPRYHRLADEIIRLGSRAEGVIYAVPGHPAIDEPTFGPIRALAIAEGIPLRIIPGLSILNAAQTALDLDMNQPLQIVPASNVAHLQHPPLSPDQPALITHLYSGHLSQKVKKMLLNRYEAEAEVTLVQGAGGNEERLTRLPLTDLDQMSGFDETTILYMPADMANASFVTFQEIIAQLRGPAGCPWDRKQTHRTMRPYLLEETYEVLEALDAGDPAALAEELGDLLMLIALMTQIAIDNGQFKMGDVIGHISRKMIRRHPHVFGDVEVADAEEVLANWEAIKKAEKADNGKAKQRESVLDGLPPGMPALAETLTISERVVRVGFEWPDIDGVLDKLIEEAREITTATDHAHLETEIGDFLFSAVNLARWHHVDPESALRATNARFSRRFKRVEALAAAQGQAVTDLSLPEMLTLWREAKQIEG